VLVVWTHGYTRCVDKAGSACGLNLIAAARASEYPLATLTSLSWPSWSRLPATGGFVAVASGKYDPNCSLFVPSAGRMFFSYQRSSIWGFLLVPRAEIGWSCRYRACCRAFVGCCCSCGQFSCWPSNMRLMKTISLIESWPLSNSYCLCIHLSCDAAFVVFAFVVLYTVCSVQIRFSLSS